MINKKKEKKGHKVYLKSINLNLTLRSIGLYINSPNFYIIIVFSIIILSFVIRFYNFPNRWGLGTDDARDALIALEALKRHELPLMGPFSSAGAFVTGGIYYWFIMASYLILPNFVFSP